MQRINFGRILNLSVRRGQPVLDPPPRIIREMKLHEKLPLAIIANRPGGLASPGRLRGRETFDLAGVDTGYTRRVAS